MLAPPDKSWLDISTFEQLCRQSRTHINTGAKDEALICLLAADRLYTGDLFEDIPAEYADDAERDGAGRKRYWLREMYLQCSARRRTHSPRTAGFFGGPRRTVKKRSRSIRFASPRMKKRCGCSLPRGGARRSIASSRFM